MVHAKDILLYNLNEIITNNKKKKRRIVMRKLSLKTFSYYYLLRLNKNNNFKVNQMLKDVEESNVRLYAPLLAWCYLTKKTVPSSSRLADDLFHLRVLEPVNETTFLTYCKTSSNEELNKFTHSYWAENKRRENEVSLKEEYRTFFLLQKEEKHLSSYKLAKMAQAQPANFNAFLKGKLNRLSLQKCEL